MIRKPHYYDNYEDPTPYEDGVDSLAFYEDCIWRVVSYDEERDDEYGVDRISSYYKLAFLFGSEPAGDLCVRVRCRDVNLVNEMEAIAHAVDMKEIK